MKVEDIDFDNSLLDEKSYENVLIYDISYKTFMDAKPLCIRFDKVYGVIKIYDGARYLKLFGPKMYNAIYDRINYLKMKKVILNTLLTIILQESELIHIILYL